MLHVHFAIILAAASITCAKSQTRANGQTKTTLENFAPFANLSSVYIKLMDNVLKNLQVKSEVDVSDKCSRDTQRMVQGVRENAPWALSMMDAMGKPSSGFLEGGVTLIGFHSECVAVTAIGGSFNGQYCLVTFNTGSNSGSTVPPSQANIPRQSWTVLTSGSLRVGFCIPSTCLPEEVKSAVNKSFLSMLDVSVNQVACSVEENDLSRDAAAISIISLFSIFLFLVFLGTCYDIMISVFGSNWRRALRNCGKSNSQNMATNSTDMLCPPPPQTDGKESSGNILGKLLMSFSAKTNGKKILDMGDTPQSNILCLHGIRTLSMILIIFGHTFSFATQWLFFRNPASAMAVPKGFLAQTFANMTLAVDSFLYLSGFLVTYLTLKAMEKTGGKLNIGMFYFHRFLRMTPLMMAVIAFSAVVMRHVGSGPNWLETIKMYDSWCRDNWWTNMIYLNNFIHRKHMCLSHTWYSAVDMQFYLVAPLLIIPVYRRFLWGGIVWTLLMLTTVLVTAVLTAVNDYPATAYIGTVVPQELMDDYYGAIYIKPYCRMGPYLVGMAFGYFMHVTKGDVTLKKKHTALLWVLSITGNLAVLYSMWPANEGHLPSTAGAAIYSAISRTVWALGLAWLTFACVTDRAGFINTILSWKALLPASRLTYAAYLIHPLVMCVFYGMMENVVDFSISFTVYLFLGNVFITYCISFVLSLLFESPIVGLERLLLKKT